MLSRLPNEMAGEELSIYDMSCIHDILVRAISIAHCYRDS